MDATSPAKRRALAPLDANAISPKPKLNSKAPQKGQLPSWSPLGHKRPLHAVGLSENSPVKKQCQEPQPQSQSRLRSTIDRLQPASLSVTATGKGYGSARDGEVE